MAGCAGASLGDETETLELSPRELTVTVFDGQVIAQPFNAMLVRSDGTRENVSRETTFELADAAFGRWYGSTLELDGKAVGPTQISATFGDMVVTADVTVAARWHVIADNAPAYAPDVFARAQKTTACAPALAYPAAGAIVPGNFGGLEMQWTDVHDDLFEVRLTAPYVDVRVYTRDMAAAVPAAAWERVARDATSVDLSLSGVVERAPTVACTGAPHTLQLSRRPLDGALYYWTTEAGIVRRDMLAGDSAPMSIGMPTPSAPIKVQYVEGIDAPHSCFGCTISRDGGRIALPDADFGSIYDLEHNRVVIAMNGNSPIGWTSATFTPDARKLVAERHGQLSLISDTGALLRALPPASIGHAMDPRLSPDGAVLANIEWNGVSAQAGSSIVVRRYDDATSSFEQATTLVGAKPGVAVYAPAWSPDGQWLAFTRATGWGTPTSTASLWIIKTDGSQPALQLTTPTTDLELQAAWQPHVQRVASTGERFFFLAYSSTQDIGMTSTDVNQLWVQPFFADRALRGGDPNEVTGIALRMLFQNPETANRITGWATPPVR